ncbi:LAMI_0D07734g1_1 [Lachancea mirantina]|uniref:Nitrogen permease regulator 3 n=1 Tax=Lachancea mirantina TaxID=1230905 RepID=A0A1G4JD65_9SACH|nr:LAMI_0D07734g1_1 [Lachancea mirantina]
MFLNLPNPCLVGIVLTISTSSGPLVVYHYPPTSQLSLKKQHKHQKFLKDREPPSTNARHSVVSRNSSLGHYSHSRQAENEAVSTHVSSGTGSDIPDDSSSSDNDASSGLSESDISTDEADTSSSSSSCHEDELHPRPTGLEDFDFGESAQSQVTPKNPAFNSYMDAHKLFEFLSNDASKRNSVSSKQPPSRTRGTSLNSATQINDELVSSLIEDQTFEEGFQDLGKIQNFDTEFFAEISCPPKEMCNSRFELSIENFTLLGLPVHKDADGSWRKSSKRKTHSSRQRSSASREHNRSESQDGQAKSRAAPNESGIARDSSQTDESIEEGRPESRQSRREFRELGSSMNMFHLCFMMDPELVEYNERVEDMYHYVASRLALFLRYAQSKNDYVSRECAQILREKDRVLKYSEVYKSTRGSSNKAKYLYKNILAQSSLARAITKCFNAISTNKVVNLELDGDRMISLQIPIKNEFSSLPNMKIDPVLRGSYLTSVLNKTFLERSASFSSDLAGDLSQIDDNDDLLDYALLLLDEPASIIQKLEDSSWGDSVASVIITSIVKHLKPTLPLRSYYHLVDQVLQRGGTKIEEQRENPFRTSVLRSLALHLMYWRHARVIIPVSSKNTYIVSPLAPLNGTRVDDFSNAGLDIGSTAEKALIYQNQDIFSRRFPSLPPLSSFLSLMSSSKPRSFGFLIPSKDHKSIYLSALTWLIRYGYVTQLLTFVCIRVDVRIKIAVDEDLERDGIKPRDFARAKNLLTAANDNAISTKPSDSPFTSTSNLENIYLAEDEFLDDSDFTIILEPIRANAIEKRWLYKCVEGQPPEIQVLFHKVLKYFNGKTALEMVQMREGITSHDMKRLLAALDKYAVEIKHW